MNAAQGRMTSLAILALFMGTAILGVSALQAHAQAKMPTEKVQLATKTELKRGLTVDLETLEAQARTAHEALQAALTQIRVAEAEVAAATVGSVEADAAGEAWIKAQGAAVEAQDTFDVAMRALEEGRTTKAKAATAFADERCTADDGKDVDIARLCAKRAAVRAEAAAKSATRESLGPVGP
jgi:hypothetical protein